MKLIKKRIRHAESRIPLKFKIWLYFIIFTVIVFALLWVFQIFFLERFYRGMAYRSAMKSMDTIVESYENDYTQKLVFILENNSLLS